MIEKMRPGIETVRATFEDAKESGDGAITFDCPGCEAEGHPDEEFTVFANGATSCRRAARAGRDFNREHCRPVREALGLGVEVEPGFIVETLFDGTLTLLCDSARSSRALTIARNRKDDLWSDEINLNQGDARLKFVRRLEGFDALQKEEIGKALLRLAARRRETRKVVKDDDDGEIIEYVTFKELSDGRLIEQINDGRFVIYDGSGVDYGAHVDCDGVTYAPITGDPCIEDNDLHLPDQVSEFGDEVALDKLIEEYLAQFCDAPARELKFAAKLIRLTYIQDKLNEVPYLHVVGPSGSGKTRMSDVVGMACHRPYLIVEGSAASTFRISDKYGVTMCFDEFNPVTDSEDQQALIQILNAGFQRRRKVPRVEKGANGEFVTRSFRPFGIKIFSGLKLTQSYAFQRRTIPIQLSVTTNPNIPYCDDGLIEELSAPLREKLTLWRLRNWHRDFRSLLRQTEAVFKAKNIHPGFIQIGAPMAMLIKDENLSDEFISTMETRTEDARQDRRETFDGQTVSLIHSRLFDVLEDGAVSWKVKGDLPELVEGEPCEGLRVEFLADILNQDLPEKKKVFPQRYGITIRSLGFRTKELTKGAYRKKTAVVFCWNDFARVFNSFSLAVPADFVPAVPAIEAKPNNGNEMPAPEQFENEPPEKNSSGPRISADTTDLSHIAGTAGTDFQEAEGGEINCELPEQSDIVPAIVALDTETEPFTDKYSQSKTWVKFREMGKTPVTPRTARMIGLSLSYDGAERTIYTTEAGAWALLMPEAEMVTVMHNAKFDLSVLKRTGLPTPEKWECTQIASHLLNEIGNHGLKPLAKEHLGIDEPVTFQDADRMRVLNPEIFEEYARNDARYTFRLWPKFARELERQGLMKVYQTEKSVALVTSAMEDAGLKVDVSQMEEMKRSVDAEIKRIKSFIFEIAGCEFDLNSARAVGVILYDTLNLPCHNMTKGGQRSVDKQTLSELRGQHPVVDGILEWREIDKIARDFLTTLPAFADENGRVHPEFNQLGATSGRFSCSAPNVQQIPKHSELGKKLRKMFVAEEGSALVVGDWSQMELRILAQYSKDPLLLSAYTGENGIDLHRLTASKMFGKSEAGVTDSERTVAKMINFGIAYGITPAGLFTRLRPQGLDVTLEQCEQFIDDYFNAYSGVQKFINDVEMRLKERGYVKNWFGRRRRLSGRTKREIRQASNFLIQGAAADIAKAAMVRLHAVLPEGARLISIVHDEFIVECRQEQAEDVRQLMVETMQTAPEGFVVPMVVEAKIAANWGDAK